MPTNFPCPCGAVLSVPDQYAGKRVRCSECNAVSTVALSLDDAPPEPVATPRFVNGRPVLTAEAPPAPEPQADPNNPFAFEPPGEAAKKKNPEVQEAEQGKAAGSLEGQMIGGGVAGGVLMIVIAVVWFVVGLAFDMIYFYPPILFVIGIVAILKGLLEKAK